MKKFILAGAIFALAGSSLAEEKGKTITLKLSQPLELYGGFTAGYFYTTNPEDDGFKVTNAVIGLKGNTDDETFGFEIAVGSFLGASLWDGGIWDGENYKTPFSYTTGDVTQNEFGILWGYVSYSPVKNLTLDIGYLTTNVGYEVINTYDNPNITLGTVWFAQPVIYPGIRATYEITEDISVYAEYNNDAINPRKEAFAVGSLGSIKNLEYAISYYDYTGYKNLVDLVLGYSLTETLELGLNVDYQWLDDSYKDANNLQDDSAYGVALYIIPSFGEEISVPVRLEYFDEGKSQIYSGAYADTGYSITVTPTYRPSENTFIRVEVGYLATDKKVFDNGNKDNKTTLALEAGFTF